MRPTATLTFLEALVAGGPELAVRKCCRLVDSSCNYNLNTPVLTDSLNSVPVGLN